mgnify:CR=1 FL=1
MTDTRQTPAEIPLTIVIVTWNCLPLADACLRGLLDGDLPEGTEIIVVDNASHDGTAEALATSFPRIRLIANTTNVGFAAANNQAIAIASGRMLLLLNPDAFPTTRDTLVGMLDFLDAHQDFAAAGCRLVFPDGRHQVGDAGYRPSPATIAVHALGLLHLPWRGRGLFMVRPQTLPSSSVDVDWLCGACLMVRAGVVADVGPLDQTFFMYAEDIEWGCRIRAHGYRLAYLPKLSVVHLQGGTQASKSPSTRWLDSLAWLYCRLNNTERPRAFGLLMACGFAARALAYGGFGLLPGRKHLVARGSNMWVFARRAWQLSFTSVPT